MGTLIVLVAGLVPGKGEREGGLDILDLKRQGLLKDFWGFEIFYNGFVKIMYM